MSGRTEWERHPADTARFALASVIAFFAIVVVRNAPDSVKDSTADLVRLFDRLPDGFSHLIVGMLQIAAIVAPIGVILWFRRGRWLEVALAVGTALAAAAVAALANHSGALRKRS